MERSLLSTSSPANSLPDVRTWLMPLAANLLTWQQRVLSRRQLARLDPRLLADAGISEAQRQAELAKPFWR